ncbi:hypothetical protein SETIT_9G201500v2 [Setaria italica]|uniref:Uncharacterized protein n=1 Tax=Setaria italica TaxID=4555 RepID=A0A368SII2_SETIT|nr:hypothetical protein SETIT_9G201500v2 [Setaria italica]
MSEELQRPTLTKPLPSSHGLDFWSRRRWVRCRSCSDRPRQSHFPVPMADVPWIRWSICYMRCLLVKMPAEHCQRCPLSCRI